MDLVRRFATVLAVSEQCWVIDPYLVTDAVRKPNSGLEKFIRLAASCGLPKIGLVSGVGGSLAGSVPSAASLVNLFDNFVRGLGLVTRPQIDLHVLPTSKRSSEMHDRFIGFEWSQSGRASFSLGKGLGQYNGTAFRQNYSASRQADNFVAEEFNRLVAFAIQAGTF
ncbi:hypothetical protein [Nocardioides plantarum]|uniref:Uncharacterized protein n=1 Tax=Nocardioides plantarum TaxID=29299 RepID=A0ABV5KAE1_9ACTN|nr:hypothetical protein [Nocardioides plantarum]